MTQTEGWKSFGRMCMCTSEPAMGTQRSCWTCFLFDREWSDEPHATAGSQCLDITCILRDKKS